MTPLGRHIEIVQALQAAYARENAKTYTNRRCTKHPVNITKDGYQRGSVRHQIVQHLRREKRTMSIDQIAQKLGVDRRKVNNLLCQIVQNGHIMRVKPGWLRAL
jgi:predicted transcriptional regulator of viral defense system